MPGLSLEFAQKLLVVDRTGVEAYDPPTDPVGIRIK